MAEKFFREMSCDRCGRQISLADSGPETIAEGGEKKKPIVSFTMEGEKPVEYSDLCDRCRDRCTDLLNMAGGDYKKIKTKKKKAEKTKGQDKKNGAQPTA